MKFLAIADVERPVLWEYFDKSKVEGVEFIISCGDLSAAYLEFLVTMVNCPLFYVPGNHDEAYDTHPPEGCENIDGKLTTFQGLTLFGLGGSMRYREGSHQYTEREMSLRLLRKTPALRKNGVDLFVTHAPAKGYGDLSDRAHTGFECFNTFLNRVHPQLMLHGHIHKEYGRIEQELVHESGARILNVCGYRILEI